MKIDAESLCVGCMEFKKVGQCPNPQLCGWKEGSPNGSNLQLQPRSTLKQKYLIGRVLGQGGFGITYLSCDLDKYGKAAVKEYFPRPFATRTKDRHTVSYSCPDNRLPYEYGLNKFIQEGKTLERLRGHPNIVSVSEFFSANNTAYIAMEYLEGITLEHYVRTRAGGTISFEHALNILLPVIDALREVHQANLVHRDVSPDNIILIKSGSVKLIDFGAAKQTAQTYRTQQLILKPGYAPEEQYRSDGVAGPYTDVYAIGATLYRCITGIMAPEAPERMYDDRLMAPSKLGAHLPPQAEQAILIALAVRSKERYQSVSEFQRDLTGRVNKTSVVDIASPTPGTANNLLNALRIRWITATVSTFSALFKPRREGLTLAEGTLPEHSKIRLRFTAGDQVDEILDLGNEPIIIGRNPRVANLIIHSPHISGAHLRVWTRSSKALNVEDLNSRNGTYIRKSSGDSGWLLLRGSETLGVGDSFCLSDEQIATFKVIDN